MRITRQHLSQSFQNIDLTRGVVYVIVSADNMGDLHNHVIHYNRQIVGWRTIGAPDNQIVQLLLTVIFLSPYRR